MRRTTTRELEELRRRLAELTALEEILELLAWDQEVVMPPGAEAARARQVATLTLTLHRLRCDPALVRLLGELAATEGLDPVDAANVREALRDQGRALRVPPPLVERWSALTVRAHGIWADARARADFAAFAPTLRELVDLGRQRAAAIDPERPIYEVLLEEFEPGATVATLDPLFDELRRGLVPLLAELRGCAPPPRPPALDAAIPIDTQEAIARELQGLLGFDRARGRLDRAIHPFCGGPGPSDVRVTSRYREHDLLSGLLAVIHETGHALYEQGRDPELAAQPVSRARSMGWHESQSLLWENHVGRSREFWRFLGPWLGERLPAYRGVPPETISDALAAVDPDNAIRVEADELTYPLHVGLRYRLERELFADGPRRLGIADLPEAWDAAMVTDLGVTPADAAAGVLQDVHWASGAFGYFPSYAIGGVLAAQLFAAAEAALPGLRDGLGRGEVGALRGWLTAGIHRRGSLLDSDALARAVTGQALSPAAFVAAINHKFRRAYGLAPAPEVADHAG